MAAPISVYQNGSKIIHLVRHGQGTHNAAAEAAAEAGADVAAVYNSEEHFDAKLTPLGWAQVDGARNFVSTNGLSDRIQLVVVSCLRRTLQTAVGIFSGNGELDGNPPLLMIQDERNSYRPAIPNSNRPQFLAVETCREHLGKFQCDKRRQKSEYQELFPAVDFSLINHEEDVLWSLWNDREGGELNPTVAARGVIFFKWLFTRPEKEIAVVSHDRFLHRTLTQIGQGLAVQAELTREFENCEIRSFVMEETFINNLDN